MVFTLAQLGKTLAGTDDPNRVKTVARRVDYWHGIGLFKLVSLDVGPERLGRGRVRRYPEASLSWCRLWNWLADHGLGAVELARATICIQTSLLKKEEKPLIEAAMQGEGPALFLFLDRPPTEFMDTRPTESADTWSGNWKITRSPVELKESWRGGLFINLTAAFKPDQRSPE